MTKMKSYIECSICSDRFGLDEANDEVVTPCGHVYHGSCLNKWIQRRLVEQNQVKFILNVLKINCVLEQAARTKYYVL